MYRRTRANGYSLPVSVSLATGHWPFSSVAAMLLPQARAATHSVTRDTSSQHACKPRQRDRDDETTVRAIGRASDKTNPAGQPNRTPLRLRAARTSPPVASSIGVGPRAPGYASQATRATRAWRTACMDRTGPDARTYVQARSPACNGPCIGRMHAARTHAPIDRQCTRSSKKIRVCTVAGFASLLARYLVHKETAGYWLELCNGTFSVNIQLRYQTLPQVLCIPKAPNQLLLLIVHSPYFVRLTLFCFLPFELGFVLSQLVNCSVTCQLHCYLVLALVRTWDTSVLGMFASLVW